ncbi:MAG: OmpA family protein [Elusimicrobiota bacterium]|nr:OmpA family protein [Elusimicrobiota bacterium]
MPIRKEAGKIEIGKAAAPWFVSYSDLVTQLLIFFVMLFALSAAATEDQLKRVKRCIDEYVQQNQLQRFVSTQITQKEGLIISFSEKYMFDSGKADIYPEAKEIIVNIVKLLKDEPNRISIEGHTDNMPISTPEFPSNWELSTGRATNVMRFIIDNLGFDPKRFTASGYGENLPNATILNKVIENRPHTDFSPSEWREIVNKCNDTKEKKDMNRRVDIVVKRLEIHEMRSWRRKLKEAAAKLITHDGIVKVK